MASEAVNLSLTPSVPEIVVTEPTPVNSSRVNPKAVTKQKDESPLVKSSFATEIPSNGKSEQNGAESNKRTQDPEVEASESSADFKPVPDCAQCIMPTDQNSTELQIEINEGTSSDRAEELTEDNLRTSPNWSYGCRELYGAYHNCSSFLVESKYLLPLYFLLLALPISAGFMAARFMDECPLSVATPILMFMMGIAGTLVIICRILLIIRRAILPSYPDWWMLNTTVIFGNLSLVLFLCTEMLSFLRTSPSFDHGATNYCNPTFYDFTYWMNWATVLLMTIVFLLHAPNCTLDCLRMDYQTP